MNNESKFMDTVKKIDPELFMFRLACLEFGISPLAMAKVVRSLGLLSRGTGYGRVTVHMSDRVITTIQGEESVIVNSPIDEQEVILVEGLRVSVTMKT